MTVIVPASLSSSKLREVEVYFEAGSVMSDFRFRSELDSDPPGVMLKAVTIGDLVVEVDLYYPGCPRPSGYVGMDADRDG
jgi:hypothetical protein